MKKLLFITVLFLRGISGMQGESTPERIKLSLEDAILLAQIQSVDAAVALNQLKTAYWEYRTHQAEQLPEVSFSSRLPSYSKSYGKYQNSDGSYTYLMDNSLGLYGNFSVNQNIPLTGGSVSMVSYLDFTRQLGTGAYSQYMSLPVGITLNQPFFGVNSQKWQRRIEPVRYQEAKAYYMERTEGITMTTITYFFNLLLARENLVIARQNLENADKLYEVALAKRKIGHISESELMQLHLSSLQAKSKVTEAESSLNARRFQLLSFLGLDENDVIEPEIPQDIPAVQLYYQEVLDKALANNSFAKNIIRRRLEADYAVAAAKGNRRSINLYATLGYTGKDYGLPDAYQNLTTNQVVQVGVTIPLLDWGKRKGRVKVAESNREVTYHRIRQEEMNFNQSIFLLVEDFNNQAAQLEIAKEADRIAEKRYETSVETFMIGKIHTLDLNEAERSKDEARQKHIQELYSYWYNYYYIRSITLYDFLHDQSIDADIEKIVRK